MDSSFEKKNEIKISANFTPARKMSKRSAENTSLKEEFFNNVVKSCYRDIVNRKLSYLRLPVSRSRAPPKDLESASSSWLANNLPFAKGKITHTVAEYIGPSIVYKFVSRPLLHDAGERAMRALRIFNEMVEKDIEEQGFFDFKKDAVGRCILFRSYPFDQETLDKNPNVKDIDWLFRACFMDCDGKPKFPVHLREYYKFTYGLNLMPMPSFLLKYDNSLMMSEKLKYYWGAKWVSFNYRPVCVDLS